MTNSEQIIIIKKKKGHGGHHGGAWKVAYADFVTAMMALFIVLWLLNTSKPTQEAIGGYFRDPKGTADKKGTDRPDAGNAGAAKKDDMSKLEEKLKKSIEAMAGFDKLKNQVEMTITPEGLKIELMEAKNGTFFENGKAQPTDALASLLGTLSAEIAKLPNQVLIEGHTDATPYAAGSYGNWELSADRANIARRLMEDHGVHEEQVSGVRGFADRKLRTPQTPEDPSNRRVTLIIQYAPERSGSAVEYTGTQPLTGSQVAAAEEENKPADTKPHPGTTAEGKPGESKAGEAKSGEAKAGEAKTGEAKPDKPKAGEEKAEAGAGGKPFDAKGFESKLTSITK